MAEPRCVDCILFVKGLWVCIHPSSREIAPINPMIGVSNEYDRFPHAGNARSEGWPCGAKGKLWSPTQDYLATATKMASEEKSLPYNRLTGFEDDADDRLAGGTTDAEAGTG